MMNKEKNFISAVVYVHNAEKSIGGFLRTLIDVFEKNFENSEIICINDSSNDKSKEIINEVCKNEDSTIISIVNMSFFHGLELAMSAGIDLAIGDYVFEFDSTFIDYNPDLIMSIYKQSINGYDIVSALPEKKERQTSKLFYMVFQRFTSNSYKLKTERFRILSRRAINRISSMNKSVLYRKVLYANCGLNTDSIKYGIVYTKKYSLDKKEKIYRTNLAFDSLMVFTNVGYRISMLMTIIMMCLSLFVVVYTIIAYLTINPVEGWTTIILFLSFCFCGLFGILTMVIKYLHILVNMVFKRSNYNYASIEKVQSIREE